MRPILFAALVPLALAACQQKPADEASGASAAPAAQPSAGTSATPSPRDTIGIPKGGIPLALQGNWGLVPADCTSTRGDAKGLLRVSATTLTFYESVGMLGTIEMRGDDRLRAGFMFSGEGMSWARTETLAVSDGGKTLTRTERGGEEPGGPFTYTRCPA